MKHKHAELIKAWADGAEIEVRVKKTDEWCLAKNPYWSDDCEYRIKPEPKPDLVRRAIIYNLIDKYCDASGVISNACNSLLGANLKITYDGETGKPKSVELIK